MNRARALCLALLLTLPACAARQSAELPAPVTGAEQIATLTDSLRGKRIGVVTNAAARIGGRSVMDRLQDQGLATALVLTPEHGYDVLADAGEKVEKQALPFPVFSLYGQHKKPPAEVMQQLDVLLFDLPDVGVRVFTYISTLHYLMEAAAEQGKTVIVLDRPNPLGAYVDGPLLDEKFRSFVGLHRIPFVHGLTVGELAQMIAGEGWLKDGLRPDLKILAVKSWRHDQRWDLPLPPSPNLPNTQAIALYPSLVWFEGTPLSVGRGTDFPFQVVGSPELPFGAFQFTPESRPGAKQPQGQGQLHHGDDHRHSVANGLSLKPLLRWYSAYKSAGKPFFTRADFFDKLAGTDRLRKAIERGADEAAIRAEWEKDLNEFLKLREKYRLYP